MSLNKKQVEKLSQADTDLLAATIMQLLKYVTGPNKVS